MTTNKPYVALTIDDGPDTTTTTALLETLRAHQARATFFLISEHVTSDSLVRALVAGGHEIGNHMTRDESSIKLSSVAFDSALATAGRRLSAFGPVRWARPGGGRHNRTMIATMHKQGYECALGSIYPYDAQFASSTFSASFILAHVRPGAIIVLHDGGKRGERTRATLERVLPQLRRRGLHVVTLSELVDARAASPHTK
ncbi:MAG TPA: polysaccharide deacetylase family protein [Gemmatimonadaceae bacterium]|nr:polysaccharide deacetylase family protein [Gemmatimonadaceae bacterium]